MTPVNQEFVNDPEKGIHGDCQRAVIASLLDLPINEVPHFLQLAKGNASDFYDLIDDFLRSKGFALLITASQPKPMVFSDIDYYHEISGPSPRGNGLFHAVVGKNGQVFFDPHPSKAGLAGNPDEWQHGYLIKI
jgi:hypothetical protein